MTAKILGIHPIPIRPHFGDFVSMYFKDPIKRLLRHGRTGKFFRGNGRWTKRADRALNFPHLMHVVHTCLLHGLKDVELVMHFDGPTSEKSLPLNCR